MDIKNNNLEKSSLNFLKDILYLKTGEKLLMYSDEGSDDATIKAIQSCAKKIDVQADLLRLHSNSKLFYRVKALASKIETENYDVVCEFSEQYFYPTIAWQKGVDKGCRIYALGAIDADSFIRCIGNVNHMKLFQFGLLLNKILRQARIVQIHSALGTNIRCKMNSSNFIRKSLAKFKLTQLSNVWDPSGSLEQRGSATFMGGQVAFQGIPGTIEGTAVIDGYLWPPKEIGRIDNPIVLRINKGRVVSFAGCPSKSTILSKWLEGKEKGIKHFCIGFNPGARLSGHICEAERAFGHIAIGIGNYPFHTDGIIKNPTLIVNDTVILQNCTFVHDELLVPGKDLCLPPHCRCCVISRGD